MNCWNPLRAETPQRSEQSQARRFENVLDWAISSQAAWGQVEGSTTRANGLEQTMRLHECGAPLEGEDIVWTAARVAEAESKALGANTSDQQASDYQAAQAAATSTTINGMMSPAITGGTESAFLGTFFGAPVWQTGQHGPN